jgi:hypothetical protein|tara:strand:- start:3112 stop:3351 length:240 start_codon:yes stop_codon:yes gene_type:complete
MEKEMIPKKGDLVYLPSDITLLDTGDPSAPVEWIRLSEPTTALIVEPNFNNEDIYHKIHVKGGDWLVRTIDTMEVMSRA